MSEHRETSPLVLLDQGAEFSGDRVYRYRLWRRWASGPLLMVVGLNPSTADEMVNDPTVRRCIGFARQWGFAGLRMLNAFAFRATNPRELLTARDPRGPENYRNVRNWAIITLEEGGAILAAWGGFVDRLRLKGRVGVIVDALVDAGLAAPHGGTPVACLGLTKGVQPRHPLYLPANTRPIAYMGDGGRIVTEWRETHQ